MRIDLVSKLSYFYTTPDEQWNPEDRELFNDIARIISKNKKCCIQYDSSMSSWMQLGGHMRKINPPSYLEKAVLESSELNKFKIIHNPDCLSCNPNRTRLVCFKTKEEGSIAEAYFIGLYELEKKLDRFYSKKK